MKGIVGIYVFVLVISSLFIYITNANSWKLIDKTPKEIVDTAAKAHAMLDGRHTIGPEDLNRVIRPVLRHRLILNYRAEAEGLTPMVKRVSVMAPQFVPASTRARTVVVSFRTTEDPLT